MRIVYITDWGEKFTDVKFHFLKKIGDEIQLPVVDFLHKKNNIRGIINDISNQDIKQIIVGCGIGAYYAFYASNSTRTPALLFNPSFFFKNGCELKSDNSEIFLEKRIILSTTHSTIDNKRNLKYLKDLGYESQIKIYESLPDEIPQEFFEQNVIEFREKYFNYEMERRNKKKYSKILKVRSDIEEPVGEEQGEEQIDQWER